VAKSATDTLIGQNNFVNFTMASMTQEPSCQTCLWPTQALVEDLHPSCCIFIITLYLPSKKHYDTIIVATINLDFAGFFLVFSLFFSSVCKRVKALP
jgi:hypothetical protein